MLDIELVRYLSVAPFVFFISYVIASARERRRSETLRKSNTAKLHPIANVSWGLMFSVMAVSLVVPPFYPGLVYWNLLKDGSGIVDLFQLVGFALILAGGVLGYWARSALGRYMRVEIMVTEGHRLVKDGPYRWVRHPAYSAAITLLAGLSLFYMNPILGLITVTTLTTAVYRVRKEEELLGSPNAFGREYLEYKQRTGMFLPKL